ncbi:ketopantoate reductase family protein [Gordonia sp. ABSL1-1]|uniref:ketopantoate reductase family protein n=1 Tax=Gordonia sp. ABSL1-1 TaxID=3053923 RepID=UPI002572314E|nr:ketopantoate reductase family protein [Gordonia sp. ABSL1-1]MDL9938844.1 ketopantoate reductase family protein [Gordonia sp. ABSL1-1]
MKFVVYGAGAIGGVIAAHLFRSGIPTTVVARGAHLQAIRDHGLTLDTADGRRAYPIPAAAHAGEVEWSDDTVVVLAVKSQQTDAALADLRAHAPMTTPIVSAQNGVANEPAILRLFPQVHSITVMLPALHLEPGVVVQGSVAAPGILDIGRFPDGIDSTTVAISAALRAASFASEVRDDIAAWKYRKLITNLGNGVDAVFRPDDPHHDDLINRARTEGEAVLAAAGIRAVTAAQDKARRADHIVRRTDRDSFGTSTWQSVHRGVGDVEIDYLTGEIVLLGRLHGVPTPTNEYIQQSVALVVREGLGAGSLGVVG